jgi:hypothetical protein
MGLASLFLGWRIVFRPNCQVRIDAAGITTESRQTAWDEVGYIGAGGQHGWTKRKIYLVYQLRSRRGLSIVRNIPAELSTDEYENLMDRLTEYLGANFPHVIVN